MTVDIQQSLLNEINALGLSGLSEGEVQVRENYFRDDIPFEGCSIHSLGERYDPGPIGFHDVGYMNAITLVAADTGDAVVTSDWVPTWREKIRRWFQAQRLPVGHATGIKHHLCKVEDGKPKNSEKFPNHRIEQLIIAVWNREARTRERTRP